MFCKQQKSVGSATNQCLSLAWSLTWGSETKFETLTNGWIHKLDELSYGSVIPSGHMSPWHLGGGGGLVCECIQIPHAGAKKKCANAPPWDNTSCKCHSFFFKLFKQCHDYFYFHVQTDHWRKAIC